MKLTDDQRKVVISTALSYLGHEWGANFKCVDFVRRVYRSVGIELPRLAPTKPPLEFNIRKEELENPPPGHLMFLLDRNDPRKERIWTHLVIILPDRNCIHCSLFYGRKVTITPLPEMFKRYDFIES